MTSGEDETRLTPPPPPLYHVPHPAEVTWDKPEVKPEGSEWIPLLLLALVILVFVAIVAAVVLLTNDVQFH